jgi:hypothetical protein
MVCKMIARGRVGPLPPIERRGFVFFQFDKGLDAGLGLAVRVPMQRKQRRQPSLAEVAAFSRSGSRGSSACGCGLGRRPWYRSGSRSQNPLEFCNMAIGHGDVDPKESKPVKAHDLWPAFTHLARMRMRSLIRYTIGKAHSDACLKIV